MNTINKLLSVGISFDDTDIHGYIEGIRNSIIEAAQIRLYSDDMELRRKCDSIIETMTATLNMLEEIERESFFPIWEKMCNFAKNSIMAKKELTKEEIRTKAVSEAERYLNNAKETLKKSTIDEKVSMYNDVKYVKTAYGIIYNGVLLVLDAYLKIKGENNPIDKKKRKSIEYYRDNVGHDTRLLNFLNTLYEQAHLSGYYDGVLSTESMKSTMKIYKDFVEYFKSVTK